MKTAHYLTLACGLLGAGAALAQRTPFQIRCEDDISKTVSVLTAQQNGYSIDTHLSYRSLTAMKGGARANTYVLGLTKTESRVAIGLDGPMLQDPASGYECVAPHITVKLYYAPIVIYIGREFEAGSCAYNEILAHELHHMKTYLDHLPKVEVVVRAALAARFEAKPLYAPRGTAKDALAREIDSGWMPYIKAEMAKVEVLQAAIDSPQEYARLGKACDGAIQGILQGKQKAR
ncbi:hypothetical protein [Janthinobacterium fluminis]|uniref:DUF4157 domain-containing protein n=1 Tax=Janthinobacterium fluminis TaxID=2987524 RepID=A0ABT5JUB7_9BURK|nr:hypothetical protein [Janthinobacterium fluminis]MDC8756081.1 hypothetical protein [Janthinobacterium fluminis]